MSEKITMCVMGDFFPGGVIIDQDEICTPQVKELLNEVDLRVATLESAIGEGLAFDEEKMSNPQWRNIVYAPNRGLEKVSRLKIDVVTLANNHIFDLGAEGLHNTIKQLDKLGISHCGAGMNIQEASRPAEIQLKGKRIAIFAYMVYFKWWRAPHPAGEGKPGINIFDLDTALEQIKEAKETHDYVFVLPHWGREFSFWPEPVDVEYAKKMIDAGADGVFGSHTHLVQPSVLYKGRPILYSMGNFIFPDFYMDSDRTTFYPDENENVDDYPVTFKYEVSPNVRKIRKWADLHRRGVIGKITIGSSIEYALIPTRLNEENVLEICPFSEVIEKGVSRATFALKYLPYRFACVCYRWCHKISYRANKGIKKVKRKLSGYSKNAPRRVHK